MPALVAGTATAEDKRLARLAATLDEAAIHVWFIDLAAWSWGDDASVLDAGERARAAAFVRPPLRRGFVRARSALRRVLAMYVNATPAGLGLVAARHGRPAVAENGAVDFNVSHGGDWLAIAVGRRCTVGIDVELCCARADDAAFVQRHFSPNEAALWQLHAPERRAALFAQIWTRKEAALKALGCGLIDDLSGVDAASERALRASIERLRKRGRIQASWPAGPLSVHDLVAPAGYAAALVTLGDAKTPTTYRWRGQDLGPWSPRA